MEQWKPIAGWEQYYEVSNTGKVRTLGRDSVCGKYRGVRHYPAKEISVRISTRGYKDVELFASPRHKKVAVHALVAIAFIGPRPSGYQCNHRDGDKLNNNVENLEWVTAKRNIEHAFELGLQTQRGSRNSFAKLNSRQVAQIRERIRTSPIRTGLYDQLSQEYNVSYDTIYKIAKRHSWEHVA